MGYVLQVHQSTLTLQRCAGKTSYVTVIDWQARFVVLVDTAFGIPPGYLA